MSGQSNEGGTVVDEVARRLPVIGVMGSGAASIGVALERRAASVGDLVARMGCHLLTGGGAGVMAAAARGFVAVDGRRGLSIGVLPGSPPAARVGPPHPPPGYPNAWIELPIRTHLPWSGGDGIDPLSRNHLNVLSSDALVALDGGAGTASEITLALRYTRPVVAFLENPERELLLRPKDVPLVKTLAEVEAFVRARFHDPPLP
ncbi:MAG TPA: molybdenum cofactor carrier protein [Thermoanaerobaculia bacterium]|nr:molybdenum cofactor carrier protein [Thermoanaerobaculia bacterium]